MAERRASVSVGTRSRAGLLCAGDIWTIREASAEIATMREAYRRRRDLVTPWLDRLPGLYCRLADGRAEWFDATADAA